MHRDSEHRLHTWTPKEPSAGAATPASQTQRLPPPPLLPAHCPLSSPDTVSLLERISGKVAAGSLSSALNLLCDHGQVSGPLSGPRFSHLCLSLLIYKMGLGLPLQRVGDRGGQAAGVTSTGYSKCPAHETQCPDSPMSAGMFLVVAPPAQSRGLFPAQSLNLNPNPAQTWRSRGRRGTAADRGSLGKRALLSLNPHTTPPTWRN